MFIAATAYFSRYDLSRISTKIPTKVHAVNQRPAHKGKETQQESGRKGATFALRVWTTRRAMVEHDETWRKHS